MDATRLRYLLDKFSSLSIAVLGDYFLDKYLVIDRGIGETSLETGLEAHQVVEVRMSPGAAGTVASNLRALDVNVIALGLIGDDGDGMELQRRLENIGVDVSQLAQAKGYATPCYTKPVLRERDGSECELNRLDVKNRLPLPNSAETVIIRRLSAVLPFVDGVAIVDQVEEANCGIVTEDVRSELCRLAREQPGKLFAAESRSRIGLFRNMILKPNAKEATRSIGNGDNLSPDLDSCAYELFRKAEAPVFMTIGDEGILLCDESGPSRIGSIQVNGPIDTVGAGDSVLAGLCAALCAGATRREAAIVGNLAAAVTIRQIGTTGTASRGQIIDAFFELEAQSLSRSAQSLSVQSSKEGSSRPFPDDLPSD